MSLGIVSDTHLYSHYLRGWSKANWTTQHVWDKHRFRVRLSFKNTKGWESSGVLAKQVCEALGSIPSTEFGKPKLSPKLSLTLKIMESWKHGLDYFYERLLAGCGDTPVPEYPRGRSRVWYWRSRLPLEQSTIATWDLSQKTTPKISLSHGLGM